MPRKERTVTIWVCNRCDHEWQSRTDEEPTVCANCKSPYWDKPRRNAVPKKTHRGGKHAAG
jgi:DNA-directed RNA polymerase subunit RPC12/RpoP